MRRTLLLWSLASVMVVLAACGRTDMPAVTVFEAVTPAVASQPSPPQLPTPTTAQAVPPTSVAAPPPTQPAPEPTPAVNADQRVQVTGAGDEGVNMRAEPSISAPRMKGLLDGDQLEIVGADRQADGRVWRNVKDPSDGAVGWVAADFLAAATTAPPAGARPLAPAGTAASPPVVTKPSAPVVPAPPAPTAAPKVAAPRASPSSGTITCRDGSVWPNSIQQGACSGRGGIAP